jgi:hypothetical protein
MAAKASAGNGNWGTPGTWSPSGVPAATDTVTITHTVTYDIDDDVNTIGAITINGGGTLQWAGGVGTKTLRCSSITVGSTTAGSLILKDGTFLRCLGALTVANITGNVFTATGTVPNSQTTLSADAAVGDGYLQLTSISGFGVGDWISVYDYTNMAYNDRTDEVFYIHAISGTNVYVRRMVGPEFTLTTQTSIGNNSFHISEDTRAWEAGMKFVIDTEVFEVSSIDIYNKIIYTTANATANHTIGIKGYEGGVEIAHASGDYVYKLAATIIEATSGNSYIDVSSAGGWSNGDTIAIGGAVYTSREAKIIDSISVGGGSGGSDRINFASNLSATHTVAGLVVKLNRDCIFHGNTSDSQTGCTGYISIPTGTNVRTVNIQNLETRYTGLTTNNVTLINAGNWAGGKNIILNVCCRLSIATYGYLGVQGAYNVLKNCVTYNIGRGIYLTGNATNEYVSGNISLAADYTNGGGFYLNGYSNDSVVYNFSEMAAGYGFLQYYSNYSILGAAYSGKPALEVKYIRINYCVSGVFFGYNFESGSGSINKIKLSNVSSKTAYLESLGKYPIMRNFYGDTSTSKPIVAANFGHPMFYTSTQHLCYAVGLLENYNLIKGNHILLYMRGYGEKDESIKKSPNYSWKFTSESSNINFMLGFFAVISGRKGAVINVGGWARQSGTVNGPYLEIRDDLNTALALDEATGADWEYLKVTYTCTDDRYLYIRLGGYFTTGANMWLDQPQIDPGGCIWEAGVMHNFWRLGNANATGTRLLGNRIR